MLQIKAQVKESKAHGLGLFMTEFVSVGRIVIDASSAGLDLGLGEKELTQLDKKERQYIQHYGFRNKFIDKYHLTFDNTRFVNHSENPNVFLDEATGNVLAKRDIEIGQRIISRAIGLKAQLSIL